VQNDSSTDYYELTQEEAWIEIIPGLRTRVWGYNGTFPGPTIKARSGRRTVVTHTNKLRVPSVVHLHGGMTRPESDGFPTDLATAGEKRRYEYDNIGRAATFGITITVTTMQAESFIWVLLDSICWRAAKR
jgi:FtsP/CotA-like multicopper oxidase with cupredoxin domain